jgi:glutamine synthetase
MFHDPFRAGDNVLVLCETFVWGDDQYKTLKPANTNFRHWAKKIFEAGDHEEPWFGIEQEYAVLEKKNNFTVKPLGWPNNGYPGRQGAFYCSIGAN